MQIQMFGSHENANALKMSGLHSNAHLKNFAFVSKPGICSSFLQLHDYLQKNCLMGYIQLHLIMFRMKII